MPHVTTPDGTELFYREGGRGRPVVFGHAWPLSSDAWDAQRVWFAAQGLRAVAHDRRGHGRSGPTWDGHTMDTYADDLAVLLEHLDLRDAVLVGHSAGGGEAVRYLARHGEGRVSALVLVSAPVPSLVEGPASPGGVAREVFDRLRAGLLEDRAELYRELAVAFLGADRPGSTVSAGLLQAFWLWAMQATTVAAFEGVAAFSETDFSEDLQRIHVPTLLVHGDEDRVVPISVSALRAVRLLRDPELRIYAGAPHALPLTHARRLGEDVLAFLASRA